jgi:hypothetical protein
MSKIHTIAHRWANPKNGGRLDYSGCDVFAEVNTPFGGTIYSYGRHYPIAVWADENLILLNGRRPTDSRGYHVQGSYTGRHRSAVIAAIDHGRNDMVSVDNPMDIDINGKVLKDVVLENYEAMIKEMFDLILMQNRARTADYTRGYEYKRIQALMYHKHRGNVRGMTRPMRAFFNQSEPISFAEFAQLFGEKLADLEKIEEKKKEAERRAKQKELAAAEKARLKFLRKEPGWNFFSDSAMIRRHFGDLLVSHNDWVVTSSGINIEMTEAKHTFGLIVAGEKIARIKSSAGTFAGLPKENSFKWGCHEVKLKTIMDFGREQGWI